ncbi:MULTISPECIES: TIR domain-containing protein [unclassified Novosphingobium]|uniref:TIR domain-containing protein n=1 Tax=unclassified Novosphingobium TaxID=2644732 RepID=UPI00146BD2AC|nr:MULTISPECIES: TIR domain-containing protein [unclassified Novosphingobium]NMN03680.1 TolB-like protein/tetratricopeptide (TPR) repeat protein [Novosphingobium sp. SG919]NMN86330.1 TolB-like protein/tetratricopeptide (TPR) repeat protein [Novosphingobium sp. SG916]
MSEVATAADDMGTTTGGGSGAGGPTVFVSYARPDRARAEQLVVALQAAGLDVWWDELIAGGAAFAQSIEAALDAAEMVVVAWSAASVASDWVRDEAAHGRDRGRLVPISLDGTPPPLGFRQYQVIDFSRWDGSSDAGETRRLLAAIRAGAQGRAAARGQTVPVVPPPGTADRAGVSRRSWLAGGAAIGLAAVGGAGWWWRRGGTHAENSIAVLPLTNLSGDPTQAWFSDGLSDELRARLGQTGLFRVAAQVSSNQFRGQAVDARSVAAKLGVAYLLDGSVRRQGAAMRITVELVEAGTGLVKWSRDYDSGLSNVLAVQADIAAMVTQAIAGTLSPVARAAVQEAGTTSVDAYDAFLKGRAAYQSDIGAESDREAARLFDVAIRADPHYAQAWAARASALLDIGANYATAAEMRDLYTQAVVSAQRAVELAPRLAMAQLGMGDALFTARLDARAAAPWFARARDLGSEDAAILVPYAFFAAKTGRSAAALTAIETAIGLDPLNPLVPRAKGRMLYYAGRWDAAIAAARQALGMNAQLSGAHGDIGRALVMQGQLAEAAAAFAQEPRADVRLTGQAIVAGRQENRAAGATAMAQLQAQFGETIMYQIAQIHAQWGEPGPAIAALQRAYALLDSGLSQMACDPLLATLRGDPRFVALRGTLGL